MPLGIEKCFWEATRDGCEKGGFGLYLCAESFAKIGMLILGGGEYGGTRIISEEFISLMTEKHSEAPDSIGGFDYGLHVWVDPTEREVLLNGMLGQNVYISYSSGIVVSLNAGNNELFSDSPALKIIRKYLKSPTDEALPSRHDYKRLKDKCKHFFEYRHPIKPLAEKKGLLYFLKIKNPRPYDTRWNDILGSFSAEDNNAGILPLFIRVLQNNFSGGIDSVDFSLTGSTPIMTVTEGGTAYRIPLGLYGYEECTLTYSGEKYRVRAFAEAHDTDYGTEYRIAIVVPEMPNTR